ncbi:MAG: SecDF P1 head subdomain-containing protein, partial [Thermomicrobiales bacterium]
ASARPAVQADTSCDNMPLSIVLKADSGSGQAITEEQLEQNSETIAQRLNGLGIDDAVVTIVGDDQIDITFQRAEDVTDEVLRTIQQTGLLEFIDPQGEYLSAGTYVTTTLDWPSSATPSASPNATVYATIVDSEDIRNVYTTTDSLGQPAIAFVLAAQGRNDLVSYTRSHIQQPMSIVFDKRVVSSPVITAPIFGEGIIAGIDPADVPALVLVLSSKPLRFPMSIAETHADIDSAGCVDPSE